MVDSLTERESINLHMQEQKNLVQQARKNMQELDLPKFIVHSPIPLVPGATV